MIPPSNWDKELNDLKKSIEFRLNMMAKDIITEEVNKILGRVKIITHTSLNGRYDWFIESKKENNND